jgi:hypothetical protein
MDTVLDFIQKCLQFGKEPQRIGLCQLREQKIIPKKKEISIRNKDIKLSDLMRRAS